MSDEEQDDYVEPDVIEGYDEASDDELSDEAKKKIAET